MEDVKKSVNKVDVENTYSEDLIDFFYIQYSPLEELNHLSGVLDYSDKGDVSAFMTLFGALNDSFIKTMIETIKKIENNIGNIQIHRAAEKNRNHWPGDVLSAEITK
jgi:hypothetical protein